MKLPLNEGDALIRALLVEQWHLEVTGIHFIPIGNSAYSYRVEVQPNSSYYLKVVDQRRSAGQRTATHMEFSLPLQRFVAQLHLAEVNAPLPQPTITGALHVIHGPFLLALYTFIHGETLADAYPMSPALVRRIGQALAALHAIQPPKALQQRSPQDSLTAPFDADLLADLAALETISSHDALSSNGSVRSPGHDVNRFERFSPTVRSMQEKCSKRPWHRWPVMEMPGAGI